MSLHEQFFQMIIPFIVVALIAIYFLQNKKKLPYLEDRIKSYHALKRGDKIQIHDPRFYNFAFFIKHVKGERFFAKVKRYRTDEIEDVLLSKDQFLKLIDDTNHSANSNYYGN